MDVSSIMRLTGAQCKEMCWFVFRGVSAVSVMGTFLVLVAVAFGRLVPTGQMIPVNLNDDIYVMDADRRLIANLTQSQMPERSPAMAPDGRQIIFSVDDGKDRNLYTTSLYGLQRANLTSALPNRFFAYPSWSPDGLQIAFTAEQPIGDLDIFLFTLADGAVRRLTNNPYGDNMPIWSPDGRHMVYVAASANDPADLWVLDTRCRDCPPQPLTTGNGIDFYPAWSPDGSSIAFISNRSGSYDLYILGTHCLDSGDCTMQNPLWLRIPDLTPVPLLWSDDGQQIIFQSIREGRVPDLYAVDADCYTAQDGCLPQQVTHFNRMLWAARWRWER
ncbi:MAG: hypothetical protein K8L97_27025 [Anaerolineae bacterium]|nr:hypothetical protein [Anaerolineae bacterium]